jgi:hypothetical protein
MSGKKNSKRPSPTSSTNKQETQEDQEDQGNQGNQEKVLKFYEKTNGAYILTNLENSPFIFNNVSYPSSEHFFQAHKFKIGSTCYTKVMNSAAGGKAPFIAAKTCLGLNPNSANPNWNNDRNDLMCTALLAKFSKNQQANQELCQHSQTVLIEDAQDNDAYWGNGFWDNQIKKAIKGHYIPGQNNKLGESLMWIGTQVCPNFKFPSSYQNKLIKPYCQEWQDKNQPTGMY